MQPTQSPCALVRHSCAKQLSLMKCKQKKCQIHVCVHIAVKPVSSQEPQRSVRPNILAFQCDTKSLFLNLSLF